MAGPIHTRIISLMLAISAMAGGWLLFEYADLPQPQSTPAPDISAESAPKALSPIQAAVTPALMPKSMEITYKCQIGKRISFGDKPCATNEKTLAITASEKETPAPSPSLATLKRQAAQMESDRLDREEKFATAAFLSSAVSANDARHTRCKLIDEAVAVKDSELRQPHTPKWGDHLTGERKKLMDERFELRC